MNENTFIMVAEIPLHDFFGENPVAEIVEGYVYTVVQRIRSQISGESGRR